MTSYCHGQSDSFTTYSILSDTDALLFLVYYYRHSNDKLYTGLKLVDSNEVWSDGTPVVNWDPHYGFAEPLNNNGFVTIRRDGYMSYVSSSRPYVCQVDATGKKPSFIMYTFSQSAHSFITNLTTVTLRWSRIKTGYLHISDFYFIFPNRKVTLFAIRHRMFKTYHFVFM